MSVRFFDIRKELSLCQDTTLKNNASHCASYNVLPFTQKSKHVDRCPCAFLRRCVGGMHRADLRTFTANSAIQAPYAVCATLRLLCHHGPFDSAFAFGNLVSFGTVCHSAPCAMRHPLYSLSQILLAGAIIDSSLIFSPISPSVHQPVCSPVYQLGVGVSAHDCALSKPFPACAKPIRSQPSS
uniref:Uncharacterized protein n=1 Tax=Haptolina brevifila TaxID=156173 RepID=A0A7S2MSV0_9EUKA